MTFVKKALSALALLALAACSQLTCWLLMRRNWGAAAAALAALVLWFAVAFALWAWLLR